MGEFEQFCAENEADDLLGETIFPWELLRDGIIDSLTAAEIENILAEAEEAVRGATPEEMDKLEEPFRQRLIVILGGEANEDELE